MKVKALVVVCLFLAALLINLVPAQAVGVWEKYTEWYSDATKTEVVGWRQHYCDGTIESEGYVTEYKRIWYLQYCDWP